MSQDSNSFEMTQRLEAEGSLSTQDEYKVWDDGSDHDDVAKIYFLGGTSGIDLIKIDYTKTGQRKDGSFHGSPSIGFPQMFEINHQRKEYLESVEGYHYPGAGIQALQLKTNLRVSELMGYTGGKKFTLAVHGNKIIGFHGTAKKKLTTLGAYVTPITPTKMAAKGAKKGKIWDDGADHECVTKIHARTCFQGIQHINFDYVDKDGHPEEGKVHGSRSRRGFTLKPFEINHLDKEYLLSVDGYYDKSGVIKALQFKTNMKTSEPIDYDEEGAYLKTIPHTKLELEGGREGGRGGYFWDDGTYQGVRKVSVYYDDEYVRCIEFEYDNDGKVESRQHGRSKLEYTGKEGEFVMDYPNEYLTSVEGTFLDGIHTGTWILSLTFKTSKGRTSTVFGNASEKKNVVDFVLESKGCALVGFHGQADDDVLRSLGAYSFPMDPPLHDVEKLVAQGSD
ncbi:hypothetical protein CARUB_v10011201mg [Capsella rubella]|uniref:Jacalin-type lectin domain-containing protein n=1 Tax=Capsella rubella TaxID=81985 RepID=R0GSE3_9BRAS|nr:hypothetical protein CARUB_v10011201mg [Capsella rubella]